VPIRVLKLRDGDRAMVEITSLPLDVDDRIVFVTHADQTLDLIVVC
jgi:hypothetical protein